MIISVVHFHNYSISIREVKQVAVYAKILESCCRRAQTEPFSSAGCVLCSCVCETEGEGTDGRVETEAYSDAVFLVTAN